MYSNVASVTLTLNGRSLGTRTSGDRIFTWTAVTLAPGQNTLTATATVGGAAKTDTVVWHLA